MTPAHVEDAAAIAGVMRQEAPVPVWFVGTSRGTISVANIASRLGSGKIAGIVLTSSVTNPGKKSQQAVPDADLAGIAIPGLIMGHGGDDCYVTPWSEQEALAKQFKNAAAVEAVWDRRRRPGQSARRLRPVQPPRLPGQEKEVSPGSPPDPRPPALTAEGLFGLVEGVEAAHGAARAVGAQQAGQRAWIRNATDTNSSPYPHHGKPLPRSLKQPAGTDGDDPASASLRRVVPAVS
jgi:pimeloyl-ACP methyl ester carboxylesterase